MIGIVLSGELELDNLKPFPFDVGYSFRVMIPTHTRFIKTL
jgi:hypothetical protein